MSADRHRALPTWMSHTAGKGKKEPLKSRQKPKVSRSIFYCLNEKELVEAAVCVLTQAAQQDVELQTDRKVPERGENVAATTREKQTDLKTTTTVTTTSTTKSDDDEWSDLGDAGDLTYVSETDVDMTEVETLPYADVRQRQGVEGQRSGPLQDGLTEVSADKEAERPPAPSGAADQEDDGLQLVREIFFT